MIPAELQAVAERGLWTVRRGPENKAAPYRRVWIASIGSRAMFDTDPDKLAKRIIEKQYTKGA